MSLKLTTTKKENKRNVSYVRELLHDGLVQVGEIGRVDAEPPHLGDRQRLSAPNNQKSRAGLAFFITADLTHGKELLVGKKVIFGFVKTISDSVCCKTTEYSHFQPPQVTFG